ncbi:hypothetical protein FGO68_gene2762 [Halteria grandinella]|uniref:non-specific serine/threonine protein kinase n=1 Tax=Halteria grandinella TaxID=5974 RepID=A0A8J8T7M5_HALGN|nr:hypothetical protein FGO68_gene2762 [Halteria grandinella]
MRIIHWLLSQVTQSCSILKCAICLNHQVRQQFACCFSGYLRRENRIIYNYQIKYYMVTPASHILNGYRRVMKLGEGSFGEAYLMENMKTNKYYAMKVVSKEDVAPQFQMSELEFLKATVHPFIIRYIDDFPYPNDLSERHCIVLEYADGCDLRKKMQAKNYRITEKEAINWFTQICLALAQMHAQGLVHRDIKPENILIVGEEAGGIAKLGDFGTIKHIFAASQHTYRVGTCQYFAPEKRNLMYQGEVDVWSLGIVLYEMVSGGMFPFDYDFANGSLEDYLIKLPHLELKQMPASISQNCQFLIQKMLEKDPIKRFSTFDVLSSDIISARLKLITEEEILGAEKAQIIRKQLLDLGLNKEEGVQKEEQKEFSVTSTNANSFASKQSVPSLPSIEKQLSTLSLQPSSFQSRPESFTQKELDVFIQQIRERGHDNLVEIALLKGLMQLSRLNSEALKDVKQMEFEGIEDYEKGGIYFGEIVESERDGYGLLYCVNKKGFYCLYECEWVKGAPTKGRRVADNGKNDWTFYEGQFDAKLLRSGSGRGEKHDGIAYQGEWKDDKKNGQGELKRPDGSIYLGQFKNDKKNGSGKMTWPDGSTYLGEWKDDVRHGQGRWIQPLGNYMDGPWEKDRPNGEQKCFSKEGILLERITLVNGKKLSLQPSPPQSFTQKGLDAFIQQIRERGHDKLVEIALLKGFMQLPRLNSTGGKEVKQMEYEGSETFYQGGIYYGECVDGAREGYGLLYCISKNGGIKFLFECEWVKGAPTMGKQLIMIVEENLWEIYEGQLDARFARTGTGRIENSTGATYQGEWKDHRMNGYGKHTWPDGAVYEGQWKDDLKHGQGRMTFINGHYEDGYYENDQPIGVHKMFSKEGKLLEIKILEDENFVKIDMAEEAKAAQKFKNEAAREVKTETAKKKKKFLGLF